MAGIQFLYAILNALLVDKINKPHAGEMADAFGYLINRNANIFGKLIDGVARIEKQGLLIKPLVYQVNVGRLTNILKLSKIERSIKFVVHRKIV